MYLKVKYVKLDLFRKGEEFEYSSQKCSKHPDRTKLSLDLFDY
jgi:hypothetical protein